MSPVAGKKTNTQLNTMSSYRHSQSTDDSESVDLDALLGELCMLENALSRNSILDLSNLSESPSKPKSPSKKSEHSAQVPNNIGAKTNERLSGELKRDIDADVSGEIVEDVPDNDSAFCDYESLPSSESCTSTTTRTDLIASQEQSEIASVISSGVDGTVTTTTVTTLSDVGEEHLVLSELVHEECTGQLDLLGKLRALEEELAGKTHLTPEDEQKKIKAAKIRLALEKIKEANFRKLYVKVFSEDGSTKSILVDERQCTGEICTILTDKHHCQLNHRWSIIEILPDMHMERIYEDHQSVVKELSYWPRESNNKVLFAEREEKYELFRNPQDYLLVASSSELGHGMNESNKERLIEEFFCETGVRCPEMEGVMYLKVDGKKAWKRHYFVLRASGLYYVPKGKTKSLKDLVCLIKFDFVELYTAIEWKKKYKAPNELGFALKHPQIMKPSKHIKYLCCEDEETYKQWIMSIRIVKFGKQLYDNWHRLQRTITSDITSQSSGSSVSLPTVNGTAKSIPRVVDLTRIMPQGTGSQSSLSRGTQSSHSSLSTRSSARSLTDNIQLELCSKQDNYDEVKKRISFSDCNCEPGSPLSNEKRSSLHGSKEAIESAHMLAQQAMSKRDSLRNVGGSSVTESSTGADVDDKTLTRQTSKKTPKIPLTAATKDLANQYGVQPSVPLQSVLAQRNNLKHKSEEPTSPIAAKPPPSPKSVRELENSSLQPCVMQKTSPHRSGVRPRSPRPNSLPPPPPDMIGAKKEHSPGSPGASSYNETIQMKSMPPPPKRNENTCLTPSTGGNSPVIMRKQMMRPSSTNSATLLSANQSDFSQRLSAPLLHNNSITPTLVDIPIGQPLHEPQSAHHYSSHHISPMHIIQVPSDSAHGEARHRRKKPPPPKRSDSTRLSRELKHSVAAKPEAQATFPRGFFEDLETVMHVKQRQSHTGSVSSQQSSPDDGCNVAVVSSPHVFHIPPLKHVAKPSQDVSPNEGKAEQSAMQPDAVQPSLPLEIRKTTEATLGAPSPCSELSRSPRDLPPPPCESHEEILDMDDLPPPPPEVLAEVPPLRASEVPHLHSKVSVKPQVAQKPAPLSAKPKIVAAKPTTPEKPKVKPKPPPKPIRSPQSP